MKILVLNCGSSTLKFQLIETAAAPKSTADDVKLARGMVDRIGGASSLRFEAEGSAEEQESSATSGLRCGGAPGRSWRRSIHHFGIH